MDKNFPSSAIESFLAFLRTAQDEYRRADLNEQESNAVTQDILHSLELCKHSYHEYAKLSKGLGEVRRKRRDAKDTRTMLGPIAQWVEEHQTLVKGIECLLGEVRKAERSTQNRVYTPRTNFEEELL